MKKLSILLVFLIMISSSTHATIRRLQYWGNPVAGVDYATGDAAVAASSNGDTILIFHSTTLISFTVNKRLVLIGPGSFNWENQGLQAIPISGTINVTLTTGSDGTIITGCRVQIQTSGTGPINNVKITNCEQSGDWTFNGNFTFDNWEFSKSWIRYYIISNINGSTKLTNLKIFNCISEGVNSNYPMLRLGNTTGQTGIIENCSFSSIGGNFSLTNNAFLIQNCVFYNSSPSNYANAIFNNNIFTTTPSPAILGSNNIFNATAANLFVGVPTNVSSSFDGRYMLKAGSPAAAAGINGVDCGAFGGVNPYKLSVIPAIPAFYKLTAPSTATSNGPYQITFSVRSNN